MIVDRPTPRIGDRWTFRTFVPGGGSPLVLEHVVAAVETDGRFEVRVRRQATEGDWLKQRFDANFNRVSRELVPDEAVHFDPPFALFRFPMRPGLRWQTHAVQRQDGEDARRRIEIDARVVREEAIAVPAGRYAAWRIEAVHQASGMRIDTVYWYAPAAKRSVRGEERTQTAQGTSDLVYEMLDCRVA